MYDLYAMQARRERPTGYSTLAPEAAFGFYYRFGRVSCGVWLDSDHSRLDALGVEQLLFHRGLFRGGVPGGWFAWRGVLAAGYRPEVRDGAVTLLGPNGRADLSNPFGEPAREEPYFCRGWIDRRTSEPQAPFWVWGSGVLTLDFVAPAPDDGDTLAGRAPRAALRDRENRHDSGSSHRRALASVAGRDSGYLRNGPAVRAETHTH